jgi:hypothetical protein
MITLLKALWAMIARIYMIYVIYRDRTTNMTLFTPSISCLQGWPDPTVEA